MLKVNRVDIIDVVYWFRVLCHLQDKLTKSSNITNSLVILFAICLQPNIFIKKKFLSFFSFLLSLDKIQRIT